jgi:hypothetical protein
MSALPQHRLRDAFKYARQEITKASQPDPAWSGSGIVICGGGRYLQWTLNNVRNIRRFDPTIPIEIWCLNAAEIPEPRLFEDMDCVVRNAQDWLPRFPMRRWGGWQMKMYSVLHCSFQNVMFLDADCFATRAGLSMLTHPAFTTTGALFCSDVARCHKSDLPYYSCGLVPPRIMKPPQQEWETGAFVVDKARCHAAIRLAVWFSEHSDAWWAPLAHGDKATTELAFRGTQTPHRLATAKWEDWGIEHSVDGQWCWAHLLGVKRNRAKVPKLD